MTAPAFSLPITPSRILEEAVVAFGVTQDELLGRARWYPLIRYRHATEYTVRKLCGYSYPAIARIFGNRDHTSIINAVARVQADPDLLRMADRLAFQIEVSNGGSFT